MAFTPTPFKGVLRAALAALLLGAMLVPAAPALAASGRAFPSYDNNGGGSPFKLDQNSCAGHNGRHREQSGVACGADLGGDFSQHNNSSGNARHQPPSAFGLQFDSGED